MARVERPRFGLVYWKDREPKQTIWLATAEAQDRKRRALTLNGYHVREKAR